MKAGWIGLGAMGAPMARRLQQAGYLTQVWNRTVSKAEDFARDTDVMVAPTLEQLVRDCQIIFTCISRDEDVREMVQALTPALSPGQIVVDTSTISADTARAIAKELAVYNVGFLDAPVSGGVEGARLGTLAMMIGGDGALLARAEPLLQCLASRIMHMGPSGMGQATKAVNQAMAAGINQAVTEALAFAQALGLPLDKVIEVIGQGAAANWFLAHRGPTMLSNQYPPGFKVALHLKDLNICKEMAHRLGAHLATVELTLAHYKRLIEAGYGDEDISALFRLKSALFRRKNEQNSN